MIITIARQSGCSGDKIGQALAEKYKIPFFDKEGIKKIAKEKGLLEKYPYLRNIGYAGSCAESRIRTCRHQKKTSICADSRSGCLSRLSKTYRVYHRRYRPDSSRIRSTQKSPGGWRSPYYRNS